MQASSAALCDTSVMFEASQNQCNFWQRPLHKLFKSTSFQIQSSHNKSQLSNPESICLNENSLPVLTLLIPALDFFFFFFNHEFRSS